MFRSDEPWRGRNVLSQSPIQAAAVVVAPVISVVQPVLWLGEIAGMRRRRSTLLSGARGDVVEIGAGTGLNIAHYPDGIARRFYPQQRNRLLEQTTMAREMYRL
jgi:hypothetical protein